MYNHILYFSYWIFNSLVISVAHYFDPSGYELGTWKFTSIESAIYSGFWVTFVVWIFWDFAFANKLDLKNAPIRAFFWFYVSNVAGIWMTAHMSSFTGFGISSFSKAFYLAFFATLFQKMIKKVIFRSV